MAKKKSGNPRLAFSPRDSRGSHYAQQLRGVSQEIGRIVLRMTRPGIGGIEMQSLLAMVKDTLFRYSEIIEPWAEEVALDMVSAINADNIKLWKNVSSRIARNLAGSGGNALVAGTLRDRIRANTGLIKSLPTDTAQKLDEIVMNGFANGLRTDSIAAEIAKMQGMSANRAAVIAFTEVGKASAELTMIRAQSYGSSGYIWRTSLDDVVRNSHAGMEGEFVEWDKPPTLDGMTGHAGTLPWCRCWEEVVMPGEMGGREVA